ncbi:MAG: HWE histidine kinase domain-containing protein [Rhodomicrobium sp.]
MGEVPPPVGAIDLSNCESEPIHIPGAIQPHGVLLAADPLSFTVIQLGGDTRRLLGRAPEEVLGQRLDALIGESAVARLREPSMQDAALSKSGVALDVRRQGQDGPLDAVAHTSGGVLIVEIEPHRSERPSDPLALVQGMIGRVQQEAKPPGFLQAVTREIRAATGFDRVMAYRFLPDESGAVIAETQAEKLKPYLGQHYPASDIPKQARDLYLRNRVRLIPDADYAPAPLLPPLNPLTGRPLDLSHSVLRSVSPVHVEYLHNMGVAASMSLSLVIDGKLWGLIACHHRTPLYLDQAVRSACELFAQMVSLQLAEKLANEAQAERLRMQDVRARLVEAMVGHRPLGETLIKSHPNLMDYIAADGVVVWWEGKPTKRGRTPDDEELEPLLAWLSASAPEAVFMTDCLSAHFPPAKDYAKTASGLVALSVSRTPRDYVLWFRAEASLTVTWAGNPDKPAHICDDGVHIGPRKSFAAWKETVKEHSRPWGEHVKEAAQALRVSILDVVLRRQDEIMREREQARMQQNFLMAELDHRVKNTIATIQALVAYSSAGAQSLEGYILGIKERLHAMAGAHSLLTQNRWEGVGLGKIVAAQTAAFGDRIALKGSKLILKPKAALSISLALHELITNAAKYGALSAPEGRVLVSWSAQTRKGERWLVFRWIEHGGPKVAPPSRRGFGRILLERSLAYDVDGEVELDFRPEGLVCTALIPIDHFFERKD